MNKYLDLVDALCEEAIHEYALAPDLSLDEALGNPTRMQTTQMSGCWRGVRAELVRELERCAELDAALRSVAPTRKLPEVLYEDSGYANRFLVDAAIHCLGPIALEALRPALCAGARASPLYAALLRKLQAIQDQRAGPSLLPCEPASEGEDEGQDPD